MYIYHDSLFRNITVSTEEKSVNIPIQITAPSSLLPVKEPPKKKTKRVELQRVSGMLTIEEVSLDKSKPKVWTQDQIIVLLKDSDKGVGLSEKRIKDIDIEGSDIDNIVEALILANGDEEYKIEHASKEILQSVIHSGTRKSITRWVFRNLLTKK